MTLLTLKEMALLTPLSQMALKIVCPWSLFPADLKKWPLKKKTE
jgi:hypothetical protein